MKKSIFFLLVGLVMMTQAQTTYNDTVRTNRWSTQMQLGVSNHANMRGNKYVGHRKVAPLFSLGVAYNLNAAWRFDFNMGYSYLYRSAHNQLAKPPQSSYMGFLPCTDRNITHLLFADINANYNIMELFRQRRAQQLNIWLGIGLGGLHGWSLHEQTWDIETTGTDGNSWTEVRSQRSNPTTIYLPVTLAIEYDIIPELTIGITSQYRAMPLDRINTPKSMWYHALTIRYNWGIQRENSSNMVMQKLLESYRDQAQYRDLLRQAADDNNNLIDQQTALRDSNNLLMQENDSLIDLIIDLRDERSRLRQQVNALAQPTTAVQTTTAAVTQNVATATPVAEKKMTTETKKKEEPVAKATLGDTCIYFDVSSSAINTEGMETIRAVANKLKEDPKKKVFIIGYASSTGNADYNLRLSQDRIYAVRKALLKAGVRPGQFLGDRANGKDNMDSAASNRKVKILIK